MLEKIKLNQVLMINLDITVNEAIVLDYLLKRRFKTKKSMDFKRSEFVKDLPIISKNEDTFYRILKSLKEKDFILYFKGSGKDVIGVCDKSLLWIAK